MRTWGIVAVLLATSFTAPAHAGCRHFLPDAAGDARPESARVGPSSDDLDLLAVDVAADDRDLTLVVRVTALAGPAATVGVDYEVSFATADASYLFAVWDAGDGPVATVWGGSSAATLGLVWQTVPVWDETRDEVRLTLPLRVMSRVAQVRRGTRLTSPHAWSGRRVATPTSAVGRSLPRSGTSAAFDQAGGDGTYTIGAPSCVRVGS